MHTGEHHNFLNFLEVTGTRSGTTGLQKPSIVMGQHESALQMYFLGYYDIPKSKVSNYTKS
jgi:hypothetical protein